LGYPLFVARRYLLASRKQAIIFVISLISILGVIVGVAALVVVLALMTGFQDQIQAKILGANAHLTILSGWSGRPLEDGNAAARRVATLPAVEVAAPVVYEKGMASSGLNAAGAAVLIKGIDPDQERRLTDIASQVQGDLSALTHPTPAGRDAVILGKELAATLGVDSGDVVRLIIARPNISPLLTVPRSREFEVVGIAEAGFYEYDTTRVYAGIETLRRFMGLQPNEATAIEARVRDPHHLSGVAAEVQGQLGQEFYVNDLVHMNRTFFSALRLEKLAMSISIGLIILVAALNIISILVLMVMEKVRDIGVLAALGATSTGIRRIFALQGLIIAGVGTLIGAALGVALAFTFDRFHLIRLPADVYFIPYVPFHVRPFDVFAVIAVTFGVSFLAALYPAWRAAQLDPSEALRYE
jgi:lipoprotein-releasing system permease protein